MNFKNNGISDTIDIVVGVVPTLILYGNFILIGLIYGAKDLLSFNNPIDEVFLISVGSIAGFAGLILSLGKFPGRINLVFYSFLLIVGILTAGYVIISLYTEPDSPDSLIEKIYIAPLFASLIVGVRRLYLNVMNKNREFD